MYIHVYKLKIRVFYFYFFPTISQASLLPCKSFGGYILQFKYRTSSIYSPLQGQNFQKTNNLTGRQFPVAVSQSQLLTPARSESPKNHTKYSLKTLVIVFEISFGFLTSNNHWPNPHTSTTIENYRLLGR